MCSCLIQWNFIGLLSFVMITGAYGGECWNASVSSTNGLNNQSFQWAVGVSKITINIDFTYRPGRHYLYINWYKNKTYGLARWFYGISIWNGSLVDIKEEQITSSNRSIFRITLLNPDLFNESSIRLDSLNSFCCCEPSYVTPKISIKYCPNLKHDIISKTFNEQDMVYGRKAILQCSNTVLIENSTIIGRQATVICNKFAQWEGPTPKCYKGKLLDLNNAAKERTFKHNDSVLLFCDQFDANFDNISIVFGNKTYIGKQFVWAQLTLTPLDNNRLVTCHQSSHDHHRSESRAVILNVQFPPLISPNTTVRSSVTLHQPGYVEFKFKSNPILSGHSAVTAFKQGKEVSNIYYVTMQTENKVILHFTKVNEIDLGEYLIMIKSPEMFATTHEVNFIVTENKETNDNQNASHESSTVIALIAVLCCVIVVALLLSLKIGKDWIRNKSQDKDKKEHSTARYRVAPNEKSSVSVLTGARPNQTGPSKSLGMQSANVSRYMNVKPNHPMESEIYELPVGNEYK